MNLFSTPKGRAVILAVLASGAIGYGVARWTAPAPAPMSADVAGKKVLYWYDPMVPTQHFDKPGKSPFMDMQLEPKYADAGDAAGGTRCVARLSISGNGLHPHRRQGVGAVVMLQRHHRIVIIEDFLA